MNRPNSIGARLKKQLSIYWFVLWIALWIVASFLFDIGFWVSLIAPLGGLIIFFAVRKGWLHLPGPENTRAIEAVNTGTTATSTKYKRGPDIVVDLELLPTAEGGRKTPMGGVDGSGYMYRGPILLPNGAFSIQLDLTPSGPVPPGGRARNIPGRFLLPDVAKARIRVGEVYEIWGGRGGISGKSLGTIKVLAAPFPKRS